MERKYLYYVTKLYYKIRANKRIGKAGTLLQNEIQHNPVGPHGGAPFGVELHDVK